MADYTTESSITEEAFTQEEHAGTNHSGRGGSSKGGARLQKTPASHGNWPMRILTIGALAAGVAALAVSPVPDRIRTMINARSADEEYFITENAPQDGNEEYFIEADAGTNETVTDTAGTDKAVTDTAGTVKVTGSPGTDVIVTEGTGSSGSVMVEKRYAATLDELRNIRFPDMPDEQTVSDAISYSADREIFSGYPDGTFHPDTLVTRGQALTLLYRAARFIDAQRTAVAGAADTASAGGKFYRIYETVRERVVEFFKFTDGEERSESVQNPDLSGNPESPVLSGNAESPDSNDVIAWAVQTGILSVNGDYNLNDLVTRAQMAAFLYRLAAYEQMDLTCTGDLSRRTDAAMVPEYARIPLSWAMEHNIYRTIVEDGLCPRIALSRGQTALLLTGFLAEALSDPLAQQITRNAQNPFPQSRSREQHDNIQETVSQIAEKYGAVGVQVAVVEHGHVTDTYAYGYATTGKNVDWMDAYHPMRIASISKVIIGVNTMRMAEDGLIFLDEPVGSYWKASFRNPAYPDIPVTIRTVLNHTSSVSGGEPIASYVLKDLQRASGWRKVEPGNISSWEYSNYAFGILGMTLERAAGKSMDEMLKEYFFRAMDIDASFYAGDLADTSRLTTLYYHDRSDGRSIPEQLSDHVPLPGTDGSKFPGGLIISAADLAKFTVLLANDGVYEGLRLLDESSVQEMERIAGRTSGGFYQAQPLRYITDAYGRNGIYYHTGSAYGVYNGFSYDPETGDGVIVLTTGATSVHDAHGNYAVCGDIFNSIYRAIAG